LPIARTLLWQVRLSRTGNEDSAVLADLAERARQGDEDAFAALIGHLGDRCMAIAFRILRDSDLAADAVQMALVTAWHQLPSLRDPDRFESWLHRTLVHICYREAKRRRLAAISYPTAIEAAYDPGDAILTVHDRDQLERGFRRLPPEQRAVLVFHYYLGLPLSEVATRLGVPPATVRSRLRYATATLRGALEADARPPAHEERPA
jgi:RNA polymerase sigma-70 factor (ECF subfamily)